MLVPRFFYSIFLEKLWRKQLFSCGRARLRHARQSLAFIMARFAMASAAVGHIQPIYLFIVRLWRDAKRSNAKLFISHRPAKRTELIVVVVEPIDDLFWSTASRRLLSRASLPSFNFRFLFFHSFAASSVCCMRARAPLCVFALLCVCIESICYSAALLFMAIIHKFLFIFTCDPSLFLNRSIYLICMLAESWSNVSVSVSIN